LGRSSKLAGHVEQEGVRIAWGKRPADLGEEENRRKVGRRKEMKRREARDLPRH